MSELLVPLRDSELGVRRVALVAFNSAAHNKPSLVRDLLPALLPTIYQETKVKVRWKTNLSLNCSFVYLITSITILISIV